MKRRQIVKPTRVLMVMVASDSQTIQAGRSCMACHFEGIKQVQDRMRPVLQLPLRTTIDVAKALALYPPQLNLDGYIRQDRNRLEPINSLTNQFSAELTSELAAAEAGLSREDFRRRIRQCARLMSLGFGQLLVSGGGIKRDTWQSNYQLVIAGLYEGNQP